MKRPITIFFIFAVFACAFLLFSGSALAGTAPDAANYFTHPGYNKTYTGEDGANHTMTVKWVGETWNKLGTVIYSINYEDVYQKDGNTYIDVMSAAEIYENARQTYPDSPQHSVYQVKWYADGSKEIVSDYRPTAPEETPPPAQTEQPEATPPATSSPEPATPVPTQPPATASKPVPTPSEAAGDTATSKPIESATPKPVPESTATPTDPSASSSPASSEETPAVTSGPTPDITEANGNMTGESAVPSPSAPAPEAEPEHAPQDAEPSRSRWVWPVIVLSGIGAAILLALYRRRKEEKDHEDHKA